MMNERVCAYLVNVTRRPQMYLHPVTISSYIHFLCGYACTVAPSYSWREDSLSTHQQDVLAFADLLTDEIGGPKFGAWIYSSPELSEAVERYPHTNSEFFARMARLVENYVRHREGSDTTSVPKQPVSNQDKGSK